MRFGQTLGNLRGNFRCFSYWQHAGVKQLPHGLPFHQLHRDVVGGSVLPELINGNDVGVIEGRCRTRFTFEALQPAGVRGERRRQNLDGDTTLQARIPRPVYLAHSARAQRGDNLIRPEFGARKQHHGARLYPHGNSRTRLLALPACKSYRASLGRTLCGIFPVSISPLGGEPCPWT